MARLIDREILEALAAGLGVREVGERLKISHQSVIRGRERIAALAIKLGVVPLTAPPHGESLAAQ